MEDDDGVIHARGRSAHRAGSEEEALNLLFLGDVNRAVAETPMNLQSSRSHCVFTMAVERREPGALTVRRGKLNLVDLAGSERRQIRRRRRRAARGEAHQPVPARAGEGGGGAERRGPARALPRQRDDHAPEGLARRELRHGDGGDREP